MKLKIKNNKSNKIAGMTLAEILIGMAVTSIIMIAVFTSYTLVNNSYTQVTDRAKISSSGRDMVGMMMRDIRMAGFKFFGDDLVVDEMIPISITSSTDVCCDQIQIMHGDYNSTLTPKFQRYRITYFGEADASDEYFLLKKKMERWDGSAWDTIFPTDGSSGETIRDYLVDMEFVPINRKGIIITDDLLNDLSVNQEDKFVRAVDLRLTFRSKDEFYKTIPDSTSEAAKRRIIHALGNAARSLSSGTLDKFFRESVVITIHTRNIGLEQ